MLVVPPYLTGGQHYFVGVSGVPGEIINLDSRQQPVLDLAYGASASQAITGFGYTTYRVQVPAIRPRARRRSIRAISSDGSSRAMRPSAVHWGTWVVPASSRSVWTLRAPMPRPTKKLEARWGNSREDP